MKKELRYYVNGGNTSYPLNYPFTKPSNCLLQSEYYPLAIQHSGFEDMVLFLRINPFKPHKKVQLKEKLGRVALSYHSSDFNNNGGICLQKKDLTNLLEIMEEDDELHFVHAEVNIYDRLVKDISEITKNE